LGLNKSRIQIENCLNILSFEMDEFENYEEKNVSNDELWPNQFLSHNAKPQKFATFNNNRGRGRGRGRGTFQSPKKQEFRRQNNSNYRNQNYRDNQNLNRDVKPLSWADQITTDWVFVTMGVGTVKKILNPATSAYYDQILDNFWKTNRDGRSISTFF
jgi:hypothetical protein